MSDSSHLTMGDTGREDYSIEEKLITSVWVHEKHINGKSIDDLRIDFENRFGKKAPKHDAMIQWERNTFTTGSVRDHNRVESPRSQTREQQQHQNRMHLESSQSSMHRSSRKIQQQQQQQQQSKTYHPSLYKTEHCQQYYEYGYCDYGERCLFAHGKYELRPIPNFRTKLCSNYYSTGYCEFGSRCAFIHEKRQKRDASDRSDSSVRPDLRSPVAEVRPSRSMRPSRRTEPSRKRTKSSELY